MDSRGVHTPTPTSTPGLTSRSTPNLSTPDFISPSTRRQRVVINSQSPRVMTHVAENDDAAEKRERRRSRVIELTRGGIGSPISPMDRRNSLGTTQGGLTNVQLADHYTSCIKLSAENKINVKNAFGLHLIDYMSQLLKTKNRNEVTNFQVASCTLDASAKIYAYRVDAVHADAFKMLGGLGHTECANKEAGDVPAEDGEIKGKKPKKSGMSSTVENNLKNINVNNFDLEFEVDPLFKKMSATFDEGGTRGLLLNHLSCRDDSMELLFDSNAVAMATFGDKVEISRNMEQVDFSEFLKGQHNLLERISTTQVCLPFADFKFMEKDQDFFGEVVSKQGKGEHAFDLNAETQPIEEDGPDYDIGGFDDAADGSDREIDGGDGTIEEQSMFVDGKSARMLQDANTSQPPILDGTVGSLVLALEPSEYSYFDSKLLSMWTGPEHWKLKPRSKDACKQGGDKKARQKKEPFVLVYQGIGEVEFEKQFIETKVATTLTKKTLDKYNKDSKTLPPELSYRADALFRLFGKASVMVKRQVEEDSQMDDGIENYDYNNPNDCANYCPGVEGDDSDNESAGFQDFSQASSHFNFSHDTTIHGNVSCNASMLESQTGVDGLVQAPRKVSKIGIDYARQAKRIDVRKLKGTMWNWLIKPHAPDKPKEPIHDPEDNEREEAVSGEQTFTELMQELPTMVSGQTAKNLSVPIAFVCLLHLANEKCLMIDGNDDLSELTVAQGV
ncbi:condensin complex subunit 2-like isoform X2 [Branchiostoma floridae]|uniref:Condensin complex subunit 2 n=1 Tax=Branchiostoma floridae TaxID=7739 RepID=A0A9J7KXV1_BRAFL|nr:condensin complex subunit 2-like isoform X2 [Branchiostoma floridae]